LEIAELLEAALEDGTDGDWMAITGYVQNLLVRLPRPLRSKPCSAKWNCCVKKSSTSGNAPL
jgi:hypothetical protein